MTQFKVNGLFHRNTATSHGKGVVDGIGGYAKSIVRLKVMGKNDDVIGQSSQDVATKLAKPTRLPGSLPVFYHFYPSTRFFKFLPVLGIPISKKKIQKKTTIFLFVCFYP